MILQRTNFIAMVRSNMFAVYCFFLYFYICYIKNYSKRYFFQFFFSILKLFNILEVFIDAIYSLDHFNFDGIETYAYYTIYTIPNLNGMELRYSKTSLLMLQISYFFSSDILKKMCKLVFGRGQIMRFLFFPCPNVTGASVDMFRTITTTVLGILCQLLSW